MTQETDDLEKLLSDVRKTISENKQFLEKILDDDENEKINEDGDPELAVDSASSEDEFEEL